MVNYARECAKAVMMYSSLALTHPRLTSDATAYENARILFGLIDSKIPTDIHISKYMAVHVDYFPDETRAGKLYEMGYTLSFGRYDLGRVIPTLLANDRLALMIDGTFDMILRVDNLADEIEKLIEFLQGRAPWELTEEELESW